MVHHPRTAFVRKLMELGFIPPFEFFFWRQDGWYCTNPTQLCHRWLGHNASHVLDNLSNQGAIGVVMGDRSENQKQGPVPRFIDESNYYLI